MILEKLDLIKAYPDYYKATSKPQIVNIEPLNYIVVQGVSSPENPVLLSAIEELYALCYAIKFDCKSKNLDFVVPKMESFWWVEGELPYDETPREEWHWKICIRMPDFVGKLEFDLACKFVEQKGKKADRVRFEEIHEGLSAQLLHLSSYEEEGPSLERLHGFIKQEGFEINGYHHEIYLIDPRKTALEKLKTILRYAIK